MNLTIAWLAQGRLRVLTPGGAARTVESQFGQSIRDRAVKAQQRHSWKAQGEGEKFLAGAVLWGRAPKDPAAVRIAITSLCRGATPRQLLYSLETNDLCAVLAVDNLGDEERRLWNKNDKRLSHLSVAADGPVACSILHQFGTANLAVRLNEESGFSEVTEGDSLDTAPRWVPGPGRRLVYQSAGIGRDKEGNFSGLGPFTIQELDIENGEVSTLVETSGQDLLTPQKTADGTLYYIRRPYTAGREVRPLHILKDAILFPFRLVYAVFQFLQFFSMRYTGKKLTNAGGARSREMDLKEMMIWGNAISAENAPKDGQDAPDLVPKTWQLIRHRPGGSPEVIARGVLAFDLASDGTAVYSNGNAIHFMGTDGKTQRVVVDAMIEQIAVIDEPAAPAK